MLAGSPRARPIALSECPAARRSRIFSRSVNVPGALVVLAALSGGLLFGIAGALIAIPTAASLLLLYREVLIPELDRR